MLNNSVKHIILKIIYFIVKFLVTRRNFANGEEFFSLKILIKKYIFLRVGLKCLEYYIKNIICQIEGYSFK